MLTRRRSLYPSIVICLVLMLAACQAAKRVVLHVDGQERVIQTYAATVGELLREAGVTLGEWDRVQPSDWAELQRNNLITVIRAREETQVAELPYTRQIIKDEAIPEGQTRLLQGGAAGSEELTYRVSYDGTTELDRQLIERRTVSEPRPEILAVGVAPSANSAAIEGTIAYLANGNAWIIRNSSDDRRPVTFSGDLDGRVFALSSDGQSLAFTRPSRMAPIEGGLPPLNELWLLDTRILQEEARSAITNVLYAEWAPDGRHLAYSTAESTAAAPGWRAHNDLWIMDTRVMTRTEVLPPHEGGALGWWGTQYAWAPTGDRFAYANAEGIGIIRVDSGQTTPMLRFPAFETYSEWAWVPQISWSPEGRFLACVAHGISSDGKPAGDSPAFDLWILDTSGPTSVQLVSQVGMWSNPRWSHVWLDAYGQPHVDLAYGISQMEALSQYGLYDLYVTDRDGSNRKKILPPEGVSGLQSIELAWSPSEQRFACIWGDDLYLADVSDNSLTPLTQDIECERVAWGGQPISSQDRE